MWSYNKKKHNYSNNNYRAAEKSSSRLRNECTAAFCRSFSDEIFITFNYAFQRFSSSHRFFFCFSCSSVLCFYYSHRVWRLMSRISDRFVLAVLFPLMAGQFGCISTHRKWFSLLDKPWISITRTRRQHGGEPSLSSGEQPKHSARSNWNNSGSYFRHHA